MTLKLELKVFYAGNFLGLSIDQVTANNTVPVTAYYLWPRTDAWEQLKLELDSKKWITASEKIRILNSTVEIMNYWRKNRTDINIEELKTQFSELKFIG